MSDAYTKESATLSEAIIKYGTLDPYDPQRVQIVNVSLDRCPVIASVIHALHAPLDCHLSPGAYPGTSSPAGTSPLHALCHHV